MVVELGVVVSLGKAAPQCGDAGGNTGDGQGKVIGPGLGGDDDFDALGEHPIHSGDIGAEVFHKGLQFIRSADLVCFALAHGGQLKVDVCHHFSDPLGMDAEDLIVGAGGPVVAGVGHAPLLGSHGAKDQCLLRLVAAVQQAFGNAHHQGDGRVVILETGEVRIVMGAHQHHGIRVFAGDRTDDVVRCAVQPHPALSLERDSQLIGAGGIHGSADGFRIGAGNGEGRRIRRATDILSVQRIVAHFAVAAVLRGQHGGCTTQMGFIGGIVDPPIIPLVYVNQHQLTGYIQPFQVGLCAAAAVDDRVGLGPSCGKVCLVAAQLHGGLLTCCSRVSQLCCFKGPCV